MTYLNLFVTFFSIALFNYGGGYAMIPLLSDELITQGWLNSTDFSNIIALSQLTPGAIAVNTATYVGYIQGAIPILGVLSASVAIPIPSIILIRILYPFYQKHRDKGWMSHVMFMVKPTVIALILSAALFIGEPLYGNGALNFVTVFITISGFVLSFKTKTSPILLMIGAMLVGMIFL
jgi:chromate transporter